LFVLAISALAIFINDFMKDYVNLEALTLAIVIGIVYNNTIGTQDVFKEGVSYSLKKLLKVGIVLLGFKLNIAVMLELGPKIILMVVTYVALALSLSYILGKVFKVNTKLAALIGVGSCICGASAVVAMAPCINADDEDSIVAVSIVSFLGAIGVIIYSAIAVSGLGLSAVQYGTWSGISLHGVAHAIAAAFAMGDVSGEIGTLVKMTRVVMLVPVSIALSMIFSDGEEENTDDVINSKKIKGASFPKYVLLFLLASVVNTMGIIPADITKYIVKSSSILILMAMTAMGVSVNFKSIMNRGLKALISGTIVFISLSSLSLWSIIKFLPSV
jgi:uncharacterized integral membrane protein (TIGR00698 family)